MSKSRKTKKQKQIRLNFTITPEQQKKLKQFKADYGLSMSKIVRLMIDNCRRPDFSTVVKNEIKRNKIKENRENNRLKAYWNLGQEERYFTTYIHMISDNINQIAHKLNANKIGYVEVYEQLDEVKRLYHQQLREEEQVIHGGNYRVFNDKRGEPFK